MAQLARLAEQSQTITAGTLNDAQEDTLTIDLGAASLLAGDQVSLIINGQTISYTASASDESNDRTMWAGWEKSFGKSDCK